MKPNNASRRHWCMDNGASEHFTCNREALHDYVPDVTPMYVKVANQEKVARAGVGSMTVCTNINGVVHRTGEGL